MAEKILDHFQGNEPIPLAVGEKFLVRMHEIPTTGYRWTVAVSPDKAIELNQDSFTLDDDALTGGGGVRVFLFAAAKKGRCSLNFFLHREWEGRDRAVEKRHYELLIG